MSLYGGCENGIGNVRYGIMSQKTNEGRRWVLIGYYSIISLQMFYAKKRTRAYTVNVDVEGL